ncbi:TldD/PmbA family protein [Methanohalophilus mahii]|uniref:Peptidase U62 modulator of DNA gyrase n=1 Tax=Methanohalophilus mahii (strain ATCC 35705 / DSM 5219 / SLP) TaxID=547558 RepID=D5EBI5_METMS|nr:TldD/PmbA family protein [Methanohalophilus mahii]ADE36536.1 peptidase U62 modulator of DNA gyrase [Methanohalophilus mahii DSM 5219]
MRESEFHDVRWIEGESTSILLDNGKIEDIKTNYGNGCGVRALCGGSWGYTSSEGVDGIDAAIKAAIELASDVDKHSPREKVSLASYSEPNVDNLPSIKENPRDVPVEEKVELLKDLSNNASCKGISSTSASYSESTLKIHYTNSEGADCEYELTRVGFAISAIASDGAAYQVGRESNFDVCGYEMFRDPEILEKAQSAGKTAVDLLGARQAKGGKGPVILDPELAGVFAHEAVGHASEADLVLEGSSILADRIGEEIASPLVNIIDDPTLHKFGYYPFDAEGMQSHRTDIITDGILNSYLHSRETAGKLGGASGNSRSQGYSAPVVRMSNTYVDNGNSNLDEMLEELGDGIYLAGSRGGQVNTGEGVFQFNAEKGYIVEDGEIGDLVRDVSLSGNTLQILKNVVLVGNDLKMHSGRCGKSGQAVPVSDGSPHLLISDALVGGVQ